MKKILCILTTMIIPVLGIAKQAYPWDSLRHEVRLGWGDPIFESGMKYEFSHLGRSRTDVTYLTGHFFGEYQYAVTGWLSAGMQLDYSGMGWKDLSDQSRHSYYHLSLLPAVRFTYYHHAWVNLYSSVFVGMTINGGTEYDVVRDTRTVCYPAFGLTALGVQVGQKGFFGAVEIGGLYAFYKEKNNMDIAMLSARMLTISVGYRWGK